MSRLCTSSKRGVEVCRGPASISSLFRLVLLFSVPNRYLGAHYLTRNRTHGSDFPLFFLLAWEFPNIVPWCFRARFWQRERIDLHRWMGTISREVGLFFCWLTVCLRNGKHHLRV
jgi:hypothetical protein